MERRIARLLYYLLHPFLVPLYAILLLMSLPVLVSLMITVKMMLMIILVVVVVNGLVPALVTYFFINPGRGLLPAGNDKMRQTYPYLVCALLFYFTAYLFKSWHLPGILYLFMLSAALLCIAALFLSLFTVLDYHALSWGGMLGMFLGMALRWQLELPLAIIIAIAGTGLASYSSLRLGKSVPAGIYTAILTGAGFMLLLFAAF